MATVPPNIGESFLDKDGNSHLIDFYAGPPIDENGLYFKVISYGYHNNMFVYIRRKADGVTWEENPLSTHETFPYSKNP